MEGLVFVLRLVAVVAATALVLEVVRRRRGGLLPARRQARPRQCPHLGFATDPFQHQNGATDEHRCYASMARERIDLGHQRQFCLASTYNRCPFLLVQAQQEGLLERIWAWRRFVSPVRQGQAAAGGAYASASGAAFLATVAPIVRALEDAVTEFASLRGSTGRELIAQAPRIAVRVLRVAVHVTRVVAAVMTPLMMRAARWLAAQVLVLLRRAQFAVAVARSRRRSSKLVQRLAPKPAAGVAPAHLQVLVAPAPAQVDMAQPAYVEVASSQPVEVAPRKVVSDTRDFVERGIAAIEAGQELEAYALFKRACKTQPDAVDGWFWRAKTSETLDEVITCLEKAMALEPDNALIAENLALAEMRREAQRTNPKPVSVPTREPSRSAAAMRRSSLVHRTQWAAVDIVRVAGALSAFLISITWLLTALPLSLRSAVAAGSGLQSLPLPDGRALTAVTHVSLLGGYDLGTALPYGIGFLALFIGLGLLGDEPWTRLWAPLLGIGSSWVWIASAASTPVDTLLVVACGLVAVAGAVTGWTILPTGMGAPPMVVRSSNALA